MSLSINEVIRRFKNIKLIVSDIDGTLVDENNELSELTVDLVKKLKEKEILFSLASQRVHSSIIPLAEKLDINIPFISLNGSLIQTADGELNLNRSVIDKKYVDRAIELANKYYIKIVLCYNDRIVYTEDNSVLRDFMSRLGTTYEQVDSYDNYTDNVLEIIMSGNDKNIVKKIQSKMTPPFGLILKSKYYRSQTYQGVYNLEIVKSGVSKKTGLKILSKHLNLTKKQVMVFGDWYNDRDLFQFGGLNIALDNAVDELKEMADYVSDKSNVEDGVGNFLKLFIDNI
ncbi:MAG: 5-amino-6-(5-phospho-D-ribitylamino)uracil phosphatase YitU [Ignavibacteria bacterium]|nr:5-amino-6-(5-phospho-D-ribitylamino)uracil phosphatase YitU [Ignavibacteria bacterium]